MNDAPQSSDLPEAQAGALEKATSDLDALVQALLSALPPTKPWQRQLRTQFTKLDREIQVLRMTVSMGRDEAEVRQAVIAVNSTLRAAQTFVSGGRSDMGTKAAVRLAFELGQKVERLAGA